MIAPSTKATVFDVPSRTAAMAVRRSRERLLAAVSADDLGHVPSDRPGPHERAERRERVAAAAQSLATLKRDERLAIALQAHGYSYAEIGRLCGWTYTKVNRCLAEGRARLRGLGSGPQGEAVA